MALRTDQVLAGRYRLRALLGRGGMAEVYDAIDERLGRPVAVKLLRPEMSVRPDIRRRFEIEARAAAGLNHPNAVAVYDTGEDDGAAWIVMERLPGETLADRMKDGAADPEWVVRLAGDVLGALEAAHAAGIVHRDIKPANILIGNDGCAKVADFGIAKSLEVTDDATGTGQLIGTPAYLAPERIDGSPATPSSDLYALGVVLYEALAGVRPFQGTTPVSIAYAVNHSRVRPLDEIRPELPRHVVDAVHRAMAREPQERFERAQEMAAALHIAPATDDPSERVVSDRTLVFERPLHAPHGRGSRILVAALVAVLLGLMALGMALADDESPAAALPDQLRDLAGDLGAADGTRADDAATRLEAVAESVETGGSGTGALANDLLTDVASWQARGELQAGAVARIRDLLLQVPGADPAAFAVPTTSPPAPPAEDRNDDAGDGDGEGKGEKKRKGNDRDD